MLNRCIFAVRVSSADERAVVGGRLEVLRRFYEPLGAGEVSQRFNEGLGLLLGSIDFGARDSHPVLCWGTNLPSGLRDPHRLIEADDAELRRLPPAIGAIAAVADRAIVVTSAGGICSLYTARSERAEAWSSHAIAASFLATGDARVNTDAIAEAIASEFVGDDRSLIEGARPLAPATKVVLTSAGASASSYWPAHERWAPIPGDEARRRAERDLLESLERQLSDAPRPLLGLTAGLDSTTVAVALSELGIDFESFTYGGSGIADAVGARATAAELGVSHDYSQIERWDDEQGFARIKAEVRWSEGGAPVGFGEVRWPERFSHWINGLGAETGRGYQWRWAAPRRERATRARLEAALAADGYGFRLLGADPEVRRRQRAWFRHRIEKAIDWGHTGWSALDVVYGDERVRRLGRYRAPLLAAGYVPAFTDQSVQAALASLPLEDRLTDGFQRRFLARRAPALVPPGSAANDRPLFPFARRRIGLRRRELRQALPSREPTVPRAGSWLTVAPWDTRPRYVEWLRDGVLGSPLIADAMGAGWCRAARSQLLRGEPVGADVVRWAAAAVALAEVLTELDQGPSRNGG